MLMRKDAVLIKDGVFTWVYKKIRQSKRVSSLRRSEDTLSIFRISCCGRQEVFIFGIYIQNLKFALLSSIHISNFCKQASRLMTARFF